MVAPPARSAGSAGSPSPWRALPTRALLLGVLGLLGLGRPATAQVDDDLRTCAPPAYPLDARRLRCVWLDLFGRPPIAPERDEWRGRGLRDLLEQAFALPEFWHNWVEEQLYFFLLVDNFRPSADRVSSLPDELCAGGLGVRDALHRIALSTSFDRRNPGPDTFVTVVMEQLLGLQVQETPRELEIGKRVYDGATGQFLGRTGSSQADVVRIAVEDRRCLETLLSREHARILRQIPDREELRCWAQELGRRPLAYPEILERWLLSAAYDRRLEVSSALPNRLFVRALFVDLVDRLPEEEEAQRMGNALDGLADARPLRAVLARLLLDSGTAHVPDRADIPDPAAWIAGLFERLLGRQVTEQELATFVEAFQDPACLPTTVVYAIVSHPEYQTW